MEACGGALKVSYEWGAPPLESVCGEKARGRLVLYSVGNHPIEGAITPSAGDLQCMNRAWLRHRGVAAIHLKGSACSRVRLAEEEGRRPSAG